jgi:hypothetical protein
MADFAAIRFQPSRPLLREISADRLNSILAEIKRNKPLPGRGITVRQTGQGTAIDLAVAVGRGGGGGSIGTHPFQVTTKVIDEILHWGIAVDSRGFTNIAPSNQGIVSGLLTTGNDNDSGWLEIDATTASDYIYLEWDEESVVAKIASVGAGGLFDPEASSITTAGNWLQIEIVEALSTFKFARKIIARADPGEDGPIITQYVKQHQLLQDICYAGNPAKYWFDFTKGLIAPEEP